MSVTFVPCIGAHYTNVLLARSFDPAHPSELLFDGTNPDSKIIGLSYLVYNGDEAPAGFAGDNDLWHQHNFNGGLCLKGGVVVGGESVDDADCVARRWPQGRPRRRVDAARLGRAGWECSWGVFAGECPELGGRTGGTAWDEPDPSLSLTGQQALGD